MSSRIKKFWNPKPITACQTKNSWFCDILEAFLQFQKASIARRNDYISIKDGPILVSNHNSLILRISVYLYNLYFTGTRLRYERKVGTT